MNCLEFKEKIFAYLDNELDADARRQFHAHMAGCAACREEVRQYELMQSAVQALPERECPEELSLKIRAAIEAERNSQKVVPLHKKPWMKIVAAAAAFVLVVGGGSIIFDAMFAANSAAPESMKSQSTSKYEVLADADIAANESANAAGNGMFSVSFSDNAVQETEAQDITKESQTDAVIAPQAPEPAGKAPAASQEAAADELRAPAETVSSQPQNDPSAPMPQAPAETMPSLPQNDPGAPMPQAPAETVPASTKEELENAKAVANVRLTVKNIMLAQDELAQIAKDLKCAAQINEDGLFCIELKLLDYDSVYKAISEMQQLVEIEKFISRDKIGDMEYTLLRIYCEPAE